MSELRELVKGLMNALSGYSSGLCKAVAVTVPHHYEDRGGKRVRVLGRHENNVNEIEVKRHGAGWGVTAKPKSAKAKLNIESALQRTDGHSYDAKTDTHTFPMGSRQKLVGLFHRADWHLVPEVVVPKPTSLAEVVEQRLASRNAYEKKQKSGVVWRKEPFLLALQNVKCSMELAPSLMGALIGVSDDYAPNAMKVLSSDAKSGAIVVDTGRKRYGAPHVVELKLNPTPRIHPDGSRTYSFDETVQHSGIQQVAAKRDADYIDREYRAMKHRLPSMKDVLLEQAAGNEDEQAAMLGLDKDKGGAVVGKMAAIRRSQTPEMSPTTTKKSPAKKTATKAKTATKKPVAKTASAKKPTTKTIARKRA